MDDADAPLDVVRDIIADVRARGDAAINELGERFDGAAAAPLKLGPADLAAAADRVQPDVVNSLREAAASIEAFHLSQKTAPHVYEHEGMTITQNRQPVDRAGCYVPGGRAWYPVDGSDDCGGIARAAGVRGSRRLCAAQRRWQGDRRHAWLQHRSQASMLFTPVGGAQAIAAMAYGTDTIDPVDVIVGPGNVFVALAKREVSGIVGVPSAFAGPSEICVVTDGSTDPRYAAIDLMVQAEHGPDGLSWLIAYDEANRGRRRSTPYARPVGRRHPGKSRYRVDAWLLAVTSRWFGTATRRSRSPTRSPPNTCSS